MLRQLKIDRSTTKIQVEYVKDGIPLSASIVRRGDDSVHANLTNKGKKYKDVIDFELTEEVHNLPYGYYDLVIKNCDCECSRYPLVIEKCKTNRPSSCNEDVGDAIETRPCPEKCVIESNLPDSESKDFCEPTEGNEICKSDGIKLDWRITKVDDDD